MWLRMAWRTRLQWKVSSRVHSMRTGLPPAERLVERVLLVAEAAAYVGLYYAHVAPGPAQRLAHDAPDDVRYLRRGHDRDAPAVHVGPAVVVFDVAVLHGGRIVPALDPDEPGLLDGAFKVAGAYAGMAQDIARESLVQLRRAGLHGLLRVEDEGQLLVLDLYLPQGLRRRELVHSHDHGHVVAPEAHVVGEQQAVRDVLMLRLGGPGVARRWKVVFRHVKAGEDGLDAVHLPGPFRVDGLHPRVRALGVQHLCDQGVPVTEVGRVLCPACGLVFCVYAWHTFACIAQNAAPPFKQILYISPPVLASSIGVLDGLFGI